jgi:Ca2+-binding EF-hand superfamily protein
MDLKYATCAALVAGAFVATPVIAADNEYASSEQGFYRLDTGHDGNIDKTEAQAWPWLQQNFDRFDHDRDGKLGKDEFAEAVNAARTARGEAFPGAGATRDPGHAFESLDTTHDGNIDKTEAQAWPWLQQNFDRFDHDRDGKLGKDEFAEAVNAARTARGEARGAAGANYDSSRTFESLDTTHDGNIDRTEAQAWPWLQQNFSQYDHDRDGKLGKDEFAEAVNAARAAPSDARGAAGATAGANRTFESLDTTHDGNIDKTEAQAWPWLQQNFDRFDHDRDSKLGKDEFAEAVNAPGPK